jgi:hypothetical protein
MLRVLGYFASVPQLSLRRRRRRRAEPKRTMHGNLAL